MNIRGILDRIMSPFMNDRPLDELRPSPRKRVGEVPRPMASTQPGAEANSKPEAVTVAPGEPVCNFEGQLKCDAQQLDVDEARYAQILKQLGLEHARMEKERPLRWRFWRSDT